MRRMRLKAEGLRFISLPGLFSVLVPKLALLPNTSLKMEGSLHRSRPLDRAEEEGNSSRPTV